jgi:hypothetical protein
MMRGVVVWMGCAALLLGVASARAEQRLSEDELRSEMAENHAMAAYVARNGMPDVAESHFLADRPPWDDHEVVLYYLDRRLEIGFARAYVLGRPEVQIARYERALTDAEVAALSSRPKVVNEARRSGGGPTDRAEDAARRAENAADRVEAAVAPVEQAASRAEAAAGRMEKSFHRSLRK